VNVVAHHQKMNVVYVMVIILYVLTVQVCQMVILMKIIAVCVIMIPKMIAMQIVMENLVVMQ
jgi:hypothetical protein